MTNAQNELRCRGLFLESGAEALLRERHVVGSKRPEISQKVPSGKIHGRLPAGFCNCPWQLVRKKLQYVYCLITSNTVTTDFRDFMQS